MDLAAALLTGSGSPYQVVNTLNNGTLPFLPDDAVIEVQAAAGPKGPSLLPVASLDPLYAGLMANVTAYEDLALRAALHGAVTTSSRPCCPTRWSPSTSTPSS